MMHAIAEELTYSQGNLTLNKIESSKRSLKGQHELIQDFDVENTTVKLQFDTGNPSRHLPLESLKRSHKGQHQTLSKFWWVEHHSLYSYNMMQAKVNVKLIQYFDVENISVNLQHDKAIYEELSCSQGSGRCPTPIHLPTKATTIPLQPKGAKG